MKNQRKLIAIIGPTASGKTGWGVEIAKKFNGEIISADSRQVYKKLDVGTGKEGQPKDGKIQDTRYPSISLRAGKIQTNSKFQIPNSKQYSNITMRQLCRSIRYIDEIPQWLIDIVDPGEKFTMFDWLEAARKVIENIFSRGKTPIVVGGTGLYIQALIEGFHLEKRQISNSKLQMKCQPVLLSARQGGNPNVKKYQRTELEKKTLEELKKIYFQLQTTDNQLDFNNPHRLIRVIERVQSDEIMIKKKPDFQALQIAIDLPREELYRRIDQRVEEWFKQGFVKEIQGLLDTGVDPKWLRKIGLEYKILARFITQNSKAKSQNLSSKLKTNNRAIGQLTRSISNTTDAGGSSNEFLAMKQEMKFAIHAYARRQLTWFRRFPEIVWCKDLKSTEKEIKNFLL